MKKLSDFILEASIENAGRALFLKSKMYLVVHEGTDWVVDGVFDDAQRAKKAADSLNSNARNMKYVVVEAKVSMPQ